MNVARALCGPADAAVTVGEAWTPLLRELREAFRTAAPDVLSVVKAPPGVGKSRALAWVAAEEAARGAAVVVGLPTLAGAQEAAATLREQQAQGAAVCPVEVRSGALRDDEGGCAVYREAAAMRDGANVRARMVGHYRNGGRKALCGVGPHACPLKASCKAAVPTMATPGEVLFCAGAGAAVAVPAELVKDGARVVVVFDESPPAVVAVDVEPGELRSVAMAKRARGWASRTGAGAAALAVAKAADQWAREAWNARGGRLGPAEDVCSVRGLAAALAASPEVMSIVDAWRAWPEPAPLPSPSPVDVRRGARGFPSPMGFEALAALADLAVHLAGGGAFTEGAPGWEWSIALSADGWKLAKRERWRPPPGVGVVVVDATPVDAEVEALAALSGRRLQTFALNVEGKAPRKALHLPGTMWQTLRLRAPGGGVSSEGARLAVAGIGRALNCAIPADGRPVKVGLLTHKVLAKPLRGDEGACADWRRAWAAAGVDLDVGHHGADGRATNRWNDVEVLCVAGDPRPHKGAVREAARVLGIEDAAGYGRALTEAAAVQAVHRARSIRRGDDVTLVWCGQTPPAVPGVTWDTIPSGKGRRTLDAEGMPGARPVDLCAWEVAEAEHVLSVGRVRELCPGAERRVVARAVKAEAARRKWVERLALHGRRTLVTYWSPQDVEGVEVAPERRGGGVEVQTPSARVFAALENAAGAVGVVVAASIIAAAGLPIGPARLGREAGAWARAKAWKAVEVKRREWWFAPTVDAAHHAAALWWAGDDEARHATAAQLAAPLDRDELAQRRAGQPAAAVDTVGMMTTPPAG